MTATGSWTRKVAVTATLATAALVLSSGAASAGTTGISSTVGAKGGSATAPGAGAESRDGAEAPPAAASTAASGFTASSPASADGFVTWKNAATGKCLELMPGLSSGDVQARPCYSSNPYQKWYETRLDTGNYTLRAKDNRGRWWCLDSNKAGSAYVRKCEDGNKNQMWAEIKRPAGWELANVATVRALDSNRNGSVYTNWYEGDRNKYQHWL
ncbi:RICIN domain-containing protein [Streptomyces sp. SAJ15]|uniref:RICIN domain-containing protein n=1 Tax=Streptomyces sp. SAJ15 TaxID=2011095 RepID=UPI001184B264|nr:RICIN domain-containing protein [Streptomyces sp. SAJ15]TVL87525.1 hypothetical protein CD790_33125 [Streptomyces sp. SAJ15]